MILSFLGRVCEQCSRAADYLKKAYLKSRLNEIGHDVYIGSDCHFTPPTISIGNDVFIGRGCCFQSAHGVIIIGSHVMFGPEVHIHGGNHQFSEIGKYMKEQNTKKPGEDGVVTIEDDCWIAACAIILKGVTIGRGSIVGAGCVVTKNIPPYSIYTTELRPVIRSRFTKEEQALHETKLSERTT